MICDNLAIGRRLRKIRLMKNISIPTLSKMIGIDNAILSHIETGKTPLTVSTLSKICKCLDTNADYIAGGDFYYIIEEDLQQCSEKTIENIQKIIRMGIEELNEK